MHMHMYIHMHMYMHMHMHMHMGMGMCTCIYNCMCKCISMCMCKSMCMYMCKCMCMNKIESILFCFNFFNVQLKISSALINWSKKGAGTKSCNISVRSSSVPVLPICTVYYAYYLRVDCPRDKGFQWKKNCKWKIRPCQMEDTTALGIKWPFLVDSTRKPTLVGFFPPMKRKPTLVGLIPPMNKHEVPTQQPWCTCIKLTPSINII